MTDARLLEARVAGLPGVALRVDPNDYSAHGWTFSDACPEAVRLAILSGALAGDGTGAAGEVLALADSRLDGIRAIEERAAAHDLIRLAMPLEQVSSVVPPSGGVATDAGRILTDVAFLKPGVWKGVTVEVADLSNMVDRFHDLAGVFSPPMRVDHGESVLGVVGWIVDLRLGPGIDEATGEETIFLRGDVLITEPDVIPKIERGTLRNRSAEFGPYVTNDGREYPMILWGAAFVDVPAVEGLPPIRLRTALNATEESPTVTETAASTTTTETTTEENVVETPEGTATETTTETTETEATLEATPAEETEQETEEPSPSSEPAETPSAGEQAPAVTTSTAQAPAVTGQASADEVAALRAEVVRLREERAEELIRLGRERGVVVPGTEGHYRILLSSDDAGIRDAARTLLEHNAPPVALGAHDGTLTGPVADESAGTDGSTGPIRLSMTAEQVSAAWDRLTPEERVEHRASLEAWQNRNR